jgi:hypothetical protein
MSSEYFLGQSNDKLNSINRKLNIFIQLNEYTNKLINCNNIIMLCLDNNDVRCNDLYLKCKTLVFEYK